jgi:hypothetical protein
VMPALQSGPRLDSSEHISPFSERAPIRLFFD